MQIELILNDRPGVLEVETRSTLLDVLRNQIGLYGAKHGCEKGECGACTVLLDGKPVNACMLLAVQAAGHRITTIEFFGSHPDLGWKQQRGLHPIQKAFVETGAIQCGYCIPAMVLSTNALLRENPNPTDEEIREALSGILCRCTGYKKPVQAVLRTAAELRGKQFKYKGYRASKSSVDESMENGQIVSGSFAPVIGDLQLQTDVLPKIKYSTDTSSWKVIGKSETKVDAVKLVQGKPAFTADVEMRGMLHAKILHSPLAHARIKNIDVSRALNLPGVAAVLTWKDIPRVVYSTAGQSDPIPGALDTFSLDNKVRFVGDRVAFVAAETEQIAREALKLIDVDYEPLPAVLNPAKAMDDGAPVIHDQPEYVPFGESDPSINLASKIRIDIGDVEQGFKDADLIFEVNIRCQKFSRYR
jgi:putative selenate reductase molybdopterin-binding subunit